MFKIVLLFIIIILFCKNGVFVIILKLKFWKVYIQYKEF